jgi:hypothetical protein
MNSEVVIKIAGSPWGLLGRELYLHTYVIDGGPLGTPHILFTEYRHMALRFPTGAAALECWRRQSPTHPFRPDGEPNRPLTAFSVEIVPADAPAEAPASIH